MQKKEMRGHFFLRISERKENHELSFSTADSKCGKDFFTHLTTPKPGPGYSEGVMKTSREGMVGLVGEEMREKRKFLVKIFSPP